jgi:glycine/D-amino acid oxidase-like deaminating enzyme
MLYRDSIGGTITALEKERMNAGPVQSSRSPDVIVVGAGVAGTSIAWRLAELGKRVLVLEQRGVCTGASGRNAGVTGAGSSMHALSRVGRAVYALTTANLSLLQGLAQELGRGFELTMTGSLDVITTEEQYAHLETVVASEQGSGVAIELIDADAARAVMPALSPSVLGAAYAPDRGHLWPFALVTGMADAAVRNGAEIRSFSKVERLVRAGDRVTGVVANGETILAEDVVLATNAWTPILLPELPAGALVPARGQILVTQPLPPLLACPFGTNFDKEYGRQTPSGQILCGGHRRLDTGEGLGTYREDVTPTVISGNARCLTELFPVLRGKARVVRAWAGIMGFTADGLPLIGRYDPAPGLTVAAGFNGGGFSWGPIVGKVIARMLSGEEHGFDLEPFRPSRFEQGAVSWANPFTAGEKNNPRQQMTLSAATAG